MAIKKFVAPNLPAPTDLYTRRQQEELVRALRIYFNQLDGFLASLSTPSAGATADRPVLNLQLGQFYFDTTLGYPVWYNGTGWVNASGSVV